LLTTLAVPGAPSVLPFGKWYDFDSLDSIRYNTQVIDPFISKALRDRRRALGLTQQVVASRSGLLQTNYSKIEQGKTDPRMGTLEEVARALSLQVMLIPNELRDTVTALTGQGPAPEEKSLFSVEPD